MSRCARTPCAVAVRPVPADNGRVDPRFEIPRRRARSPIDWPRLARWSALGTIVMLVWLLVPTVRCSFEAFRQRPISELHEDEISSSETDRERVLQGKGFVAGWLESVGVCYERTPLLGQERWKTRALEIFAALTLVTWLLGRLWVNTRPTGYA